jgi:hypothetical protein
MYEHYSWKLYKIQEGLSMILELPGSLSRSGRVIFVWGSNLSSFFGNPGDECHFNGVWNPENGLGKD